MQQIADWLQKLDLDEYADRFVENKIDIPVFPHLTDQDLKDIGVPLGHRRKIFAAINQGTEPCCSRRMRRRQLPSQRAKKRPNADISQCCFPTGRFDGAVGAPGP